MELKDKIVLITGASRGLGKFIAQRLAKEGAQLVLAARSVSELEAVAKEIGNARAVPADVAKHEDLVRLAEQAGPVDVLINNAGIETVYPYDTIPFELIDRMIAVNLLSAMKLTRLLLPGMVARKRGQIVNIASLAGKAGPPLSETYGATKAALIGFTQSLRASYEGTGVSASVVCPGFVVGEGMFADRQKSSGVKPPRMLGATTPDRVAEGVLRAIVDDVPEMLVAPGPMRVMSAFTQLFPRLPFWMIRRMQLREMYMQTVNAEKDKKDGGASAH